MSDQSLKSSLRELSLLLCRHYGQQVIILIDEYDVPLAKANERGYYDRMALLIRNIFTEQILAMFKEKTAKDGTLLNAFCSALAEGRPKEVERLFTSYMEKTVSIRDTFVRKPAKENFYHGMLLGDPRV